jgi:hypothetical protein
MKIKFRCSSHMYIIYFSFVTHAERRRKVWMTSEHLSLSVSERKKMKITSRNALSDAVQLCGARHSIYVKYVGVFPLSLLSYTRKVH